MTVILTGLRSNNDLTLGNYLGAILPMVEIQKNLSPADNYHLFVPDLHTLTADTNPSNLYSQNLQNVRYFLAAGVDPVSNPQIMIYRQSKIPAHSEMLWLLSCFTHFGEASRMIEFKEKSTRNGKTTSVGLFTYPVLMAGDILLYNANYVPVGEDQRQHLELTRDIGERINNKFGDIFTLPHPWEKQLEFSRQDKGIRIRSLANPEQKMSKSILDPKGTILLSDTPPEAAKKIMSATTDSLGYISYDWSNQPGITNLLEINRLLSGKTKVEITKEWSGMTQYGQLKQNTASLVSDFLTTFQSKLVNFNDEMIENILQKSEENCKIIANKTLYKFQVALGLRK